MLPGNATSNLWVLDLTLDLLNYLPGGITLTYNTPNIMHE
jgi:hypothetical protein